MKNAVAMLACGSILAVAIAAQGGTGSAQAPAQSGTATGQAPAQGAPAAGQATPTAPQTLVSEVQRQYTQVSNNFTRAAEQFPEEKYGWQPTPDVRTWERLVAHMTDDNNGNCFMLAGLTERPASVEMPMNDAAVATKKTKAELVAGLTAAVETCNKAFAAVTPANMLEPSGGRGNASRLGQLIVVTAHNNEHYGNMVTYMRLQGLVPPSTAGRGGRGPAPR